MFGAVATHVHNGDPLNDSTGAIGMLIRLVAIGILWSLRPHAGRQASSVRRSLLGVGATVVVCLVIAIGGSVAVRHLEPLESREYFARLAVTLAKNQRILFGS